MPHIPLAYDKEAEVKVELELHDVQISDSIINPFSYGGQNFQYFNSEKQKIDRKFLQENELSHMFEDCTVDERCFVGLPSLTFDTELDTTIMIE